MSAIRIIRAGPLATLQDRGRFGRLGEGIAASGPMDRAAYEAAGALLGERVGRGAIEFTQSFAFAAEGDMAIAVAGGDFRLRLNGEPREWPARLALKPGDQVEITPGEAGNYGYVRVDRDVEIPLTLGSLATNVTVGLGGYRNRKLRDGDVLGLAPTTSEVPETIPSPETDGFRVIWGLHAELFPADLRAQFAATPFTITRSHDRMGVRLEDETKMFATRSRLTLVSDPIVPGDIQILGDGTPIVLMRDHQPTGGYPRIATIVSADLDRFAQLRAGASVRFRPIAPKVLW